MEAHDPWGVANLNTRGMVGRIYVGDHRTFLPLKESMGAICCHGNLSSNSIRPNPYAAFHST